MCEKGETKMSSVCLVIIFNHKYNKNIKILEEMYANRFHNLYYIVPFYSEKLHGVSADKIIPVFETSYCFQGYIAQAYNKIKNTRYEHYIFIGDDQILNPKLDENNIINELGIKKGQSYIKEIIPYGEISKGSLKDQSNKLYNIITAFRINGGVNYKNEIPSYEEAKKKCEQIGLKISDKLPLSFFMEKGLIGYKYLPLTLVTLCINKGFKLPYPLFKAYSDMIIIDSQSMDEFCRLSGVFAAMNIFVETAIPLAMVLSCSSIKYENEANGWKGVEYWGIEIEEFENKYDRKFINLVNDFGEKIIYYHPIKLSKWEI